ncbi:MAG: ABC transporter substrate-binding protein [Dehalococcoidia bacterium]
MFRRVSSAIVIAATVTLIGACGGDDKSPTTTPNGSAGPSTSANTDFGPAEGVVIFGSPETTDDALNRAIEAGAPLKFFLAGSSRSDGSFDGVNLPGEATVLGTSLIDPASAEFDAAYEEAYGRSPVGLPGVREAYDAVYLVALAAAAANSTDSAAIRDNIHYVANSPGEIFNPLAMRFDEAVAILQGGGDVNYIGASGQVDLTAKGDMSKGQLEVWRRIGGSIAPQETRDVDLAAEIAADVPSGELHTAADAPGGPLRIGVVLPLSGDNADLGQAISDAIDMAVDTINAEGALFGSDIEVVRADDAGDATQAVSAAQGLVDNEGISAIIGPLGEDAAAAVASEVAGPSSILEIALSTAATLPTDPAAFLIRTRAANTLQVAVDANLALESEVDVVCVLHGSDPESQAMAEAFKAAFEHKEGGVRALVAVADGADLTACLGS